ncbi:VWA domain-containing protein [Angustibacter speluncae]
MSSHRRYRYGAWSGGPDPLAPPFDVRAAVDAVGEEVLAGGSLRAALRELLRPGWDGARGLDDLEARARRLRRDVQRRGRLDGTVTRARALLDQALAAERDALDGSDSPDAQFDRARLDALPRSTAAAVRELADYDWTSEQARADYQKILDELRGDVLEQRFAGMKQALQGADPARDPEAAARVREMLGDLNDLLAQHASGQDTTDAFRRFMDRHGEFFPDDPQSTDELVDQLARQAAAAESLMRSLSPSQREELAQLMSQALADSGLADQMASLSENLRALRPELSWDRARQTSGEEPLGYGDATGALAELADLDDLVEQLGQEHPGATLDDVDVEAVERNLGRAAADDVRRLAELERELRRQGWVTSGPDGMTLSPKALRRLGATALRHVFADLESGRRGQHDLRSAGAAGEATGASRAWEFGDTQPLDVVRTVQNALRRSASREDGAVALDVEDFEVVETERRAGASVALLVDLSYSMVAEGRWGPMKQTALALAHLVATRFPQDALQIIGFGRYAMPLTQGELAAVEPDYQQGTNLAHALALAGRHLRRHSAGDPVVLVVTDGEPTAHLESDGEATFSWPPLQETVAATVREVDALTRYGAVLNLFMLGEDQGLRRFVDAVARRSGGRVLTPSTADLGRYVVSDYLRARRGRRG